VLAAAVACPADMIGESIAVQRRLLQMHKPVVWARLGNATIAGAVKVRATADSG
jgi:hypothetical protein